MTAPPPFVVAHLVASPFFGGPERQMLALAQHLPEEFQSVFLNFGERGLSQPFCDQLHAHGLKSVVLRNNAPHVFTAAAEVAERLRGASARVLCCHGYKPDIIGSIAARRAGIPCVGVSRGWTAATARVRVYEAIDRRVLRRMHRVVCVSEGQAAKVRRAGVALERIVVIRNAVDVRRFERPSQQHAALLERFFPNAPRRIVLAAGRLSPEKGFDHLVDAASLVHMVDPSVGFILFGDGPLRAALRQRIAARALEDTFILGGFRDDVDAFMPHADIVALPSHTEGLPNIALEASAAAVPVVATAVGGTPEVIEDGVTGHLVPPGDSPALARRILQTLGSEARRIEMGQRGRARILSDFTFEAQAQRYVRLFTDIAGDSEEAPTLRAASGVAHA